MAKHSDLGISSPSFQAKFSMKKMLCPEFMAYNMPRDKNHITHGVWNEVNIWLVLPAVLRPLNKIVPLVLLNGTIPIGSGGIIAVLGEVHTTLCLAATQLRSYTVS